MKGILFVILTAMVMFSFTCPVTAQPPVTDQPSTTVQPPASDQPSTTVQPPASDEPLQKPAPAGNGEESSAGMKIVDILLVRPFCVVGSTVSTAAYIAISPVVFVMGIGEETARVMVEAPWRFTSFRYIGEFDHYKDERPIMGVWDF